MITFTEVEMALGAIIAIFAIITTCWGGIKAIREAIAPLAHLFDTTQENTRDIAQMRKDLDQMANTMGNYDEYFRKDKRELEKDREELDDLKRATTLLLRGVSQLIEHALSGNHTDELKDSKKSIDDYLYKRN